MHLGGNIYNKVGWNFFALSYLALSRNRTHVAIVSHVKVYVSPFAFHTYLTIKCMTKDIRDFIAI